jgi:crotonobetainyl-CoA:carnitine CoA-transferase CaiB-like acyl-CoA transferase
MAALTGLRVLDLSRVLAGPWASQLLADLGADVIKVERPGEGDDTRGWGPPWLQAADADGPRLSAYFVSANRGKRSLAIDIADPEGAALVRRLAGTSDVLIENFKVGGLERYGLDPAALRRATPRLITCSITGFGQDGPYAARAGYDFIIQGMGGFMSVTGRPDDEAGGGPMKAGVALTDIQTGLYAANAILAALWQRERTGEGAAIDVALLDVQAAVLANQASNYLISGRNPQRMGNAHPNIVPYQSFSVSDGEITLAVGNDGQFTRLCAVLGLPALARDERFATNAARVANRSVLVPMLQRRLLDRPGGEWLDALEAAGVPAGPINDLAEMFSDPQIVHRGMARMLPSAHFREVPVVGSPLRLDGGRADACRAPPLLGEHSREVLRERLGLDEHTLDSLAAAGTIG